MVAGAPTIFLLSAPSPAPVNRRAETARAGRDERRAASRARHFFGSRLWTCSGGAAASSTSTSCSGSALARAIAAVSSWRSTRGRTFSTASATAAAIVSSIVTTCSPWRARPARAHPAGERAPRPIRVTGNVPRDAARRMAPSDKPGAPPPDQGSAVDRRRGRHGRPARRAGAATRSVRSSRAATMAARTSEVRSIGMSPTLATSADAVRWGNFPRVCGWRPT